jgi:hypothetical protein
MVNLSPIGSDWLAENEGLVSFANAYLSTGTVVLNSVAFQIKDVRAETVRERR